MSERLSGPAVLDAAGSLPSTGWRGLYWRAITVCGSALMGGIVVVTLAQIFYRYFLADAIIWAEEASRYLLIAISFLFAGAAFARGEMVTVELMIARLSPRLRSLCLVPAYLLSIVFLVTLVWYGWRFASVTGNQTVPAADFIWTAISGSNEPLGFTMFWIYLVVPIGCAMLALHFAGGLTAEFKRLTRGE